MKANITLDGILNIDPENEIERYALRKWWEDYSSKESKGVGIQANYTGETLIIDKSKNKG